ncbi:MAG: glycosyltransferase family 2 protein [Myxococcota bacterium]
MKRKESRHKDFTLFLICRNNEERLKESIRIILNECNGRDIIAFDTESEDNTGALLKKNGIKVIDIKLDEFGHGRTRNLALKYSDSEILIFLNGDALPVRGWIGELLKSIDGYDAAFSRQIPDKGCDPLRITDLINHPYFGRNEDELICKGSNLPILFDTVSCAIKRESLMRINFPDVSFGEDYLWAHSVIKEGGGIVYSANSIVIHSHPIYREPYNLIRRHFEEGRLRSFQREKFGVEYFIKFLPSAFLLDLITISGVNISSREKVNWLLREPFLRMLQLVSFFAGLNEDRIPDIIKRRLIWSR